MLTLIGRWIYKTISYLKLRLHSFFNSKLVYSINYYLFLIPNLIIYLFKSKPVYSINKKLCFELNELVNADDPVECAKKYKIDLQGAQVRVVLKFVGSFTFPEHYYIHAEIVHENMVQALVYISRLNLITKDEHIIYIELPKRPIPQQ